MRHKIIYEKYIIYEDGRLYSLPSQRFLNVNIDKRGYCGYILSIEGKQKRLYVHRLVALNFIDNPKNLPDVNHKDSNRSNNHINNLEWMSRKDNIRYSISNGNRNINARFEKSKRHNKSSKIILDLETGIFYDSTRYAATAKCFSRSSLICKLSGHTYNDTTLKYV